VSAAYRAAEEERTRYLDLMQLFPVAVLTTDSELKIRDANDSAAKLLNLSRTALRGRQIEWFFAGDREALGAAIRNRDVFISEHTVILRPRERRSVQVKLKVHVSENLPNDEFVWVIEPTVA
jgi:PAS domain S-box-containing protein